MELTLTCNKPSPAFLRGLADLIESTDVDHNSDSKYGLGKSWGSDEIRSAWRKLTRRCQNIDIEISKAPDGYEKGALLEALGMSGKSFGGILSSHGHMMRDPQFSYLSNDDDWPARQFVGPDDRIYYQLNPDWQEYVSGLRS